MIDWNEDLEDMPRKNCEQVLVALEGVKMFRITYYVWQDYQQREGRWFGIRPSEEIRAWSRLNYPIQEKASGGVVTLPSAIVGESEPEVVVLPKVSLPPMLTSEAGPVLPSVTLPPGIK